MKVYLIDTVPSETEITGVKIGPASKVVNGGGVIQFTKQNFELASIDELEYLFERIEIRANDGSTVLWEGFITRILVRWSVLTFIAIEALRTLDKVWSRHSSVLVAGTVTGIGADYIDDSNAAFTTALETYQCLFTDIDVPSEEIVYPDSNTGFYHSGTADNPAG